MSRGVQRVEGVPVATVDAHGVTLAYLDVGTGPAVLLVPGYTGSKEDFGPVLAPLAAADFRAVAVDLRGQLDSPGAGNPESYAPTGLAADVLALIDTLGKVEEDPSTRIASTHVSYGWQELKREKFSRAIWPSRRP